MTYSMVAFIDKTTVLNIIKNNPKCMMALLEYSHDFITEAVQQIVDFGQKSIKSRVACSLLRIARFAENDFIDIPISRNDIAQYSGIATGSTIRLLADLEKEGIIVVTVAYRLGVFGYFADKELAAESPNGTTGNYGLLDQIKALEWVSKNIEAFGGDAGNITIAGESAGSSSVNAVCASPLAKGLFRRAIAESSSIVQKTPPHTFRTMQKAQESAALHDSVEVYA